jgi:hypothetical protein
LTDTSLYIYTEIYVKEGEWCEVKFVDWVVRILGGINKIGLIIDVEA